MSSDRTTATLSDYAAIMRRRWRIVVAGALIGVLLGGLYALRSGSRYTSTASVVIRPILSDPFIGTRIEDVGADTQAKILNSTVVASLAAELLETDETPRGLLTHLSVENPAGTLVLNVTYDAASPAKARDGAQAFARAYLDHRSATAEETKRRQLDQIATQRNELSAQLDGAIATISASPAGSEGRSNAEARRDVLLGQLGELDRRSAQTQAIDTEPGQIIRPAELPRAPSSQSKVLTMFAAGVVGTIAGAGLALVRDRTDPQIRSRRELVELLGSEPLGEIPRGGNARGLAAMLNSSGDEASAYRSLRVRVWPRRGVGPHRVLLAGLNQSRAAELVAANLAVTITDSGWNALLACATDADLAPQFDLDPMPRVEVVVGESPVERLLVNPPGVPGLTLLPSLAAHSDGRPAAEARLAEARLDALDARVDVEMVVGPPVLASSGSLELCPLVDAAILVFDPADSDRADLERSIELIAGVGARVLGVVTYRAPWAGTG